MRGYALLVLRLSIKNLVVRRQQLYINRQLPSNTDSVTRQLAKKMTNETTTMVANAVEEEEEEEENVVDETTTTEKMMEVNQSQGEAPTDEDKNAPESTIPTKTAALAAAATTTTTTTTTTTSTHNHHHQQQQEEEEEDKVPFRIGDHVYKWCSFAGIPGVFQHHGIITEVEGDRLTIADFSAMIRQGLNDDNVVENEQSMTIKHLLVPKHTRGRIRAVEEQSPNDWHRVEYQASWWKRTLWSRSGTCTALESDPPGVVLSRVRYLLNHPSTLPPYSIVKANCECVAVWCKTGTWATLQASNFLHTAAAGQAKSATTLALLASSTTVSVPQAGLWGWMGYTTQTTLLATQPLLAPAIATYGLVTVGGPLWTLLRARHAWHQTTQRLNHEFWQDAIAHPDIFVECITEWST